MISVLIPVLNRDVTQLVQTLIKQLKLLPVSVEIILLDDGSQTYFSKLNSVGIADTPFVEYIESKINNGRIRARQVLAEASKFEWLLFLDCDSDIVSDRFLENYYNEFNAVNQVIVGGRIYNPLKPADSGTMLHWKYGTCREAIKLGKHCHANRFMTNNFCIRKSVFKNFNFTGGWDGYGYEDSWMGMQLEAMNVPVIFIDNPVLHHGVEPSSVFIIKSEEALRNLCRLNQVTSPGILLRHVRLFNYYYRLRSWRMLWIVTLIYSMLGKVVERNLLSCKPSLLLFDLYRLNYFVKVMS